MNALADRTFYDPPVEERIREIERLLTAEYGMSHRAVAALLLQGDEEALGWVRSREAEAARIDALCEGDEAGFAIQVRLQEWATRLADEVLTHARSKPGGFGERLGRWCASPVTGGPILLFVLYVFVYQFVGVFGGGVVVAWLEQGLFGQHINPWLTALFQAHVPWEPVRMLFVGQYGIFTLGITYAVALILPLVTFFFLVFSVLEDSGYLPRLALMIDRVFKLLGLNGRAVIPIVLGFGCDTMATMVTRILETRRERIIATILLSLTIPCSAQLAVIVSMLAAHTIHVHLLGLPISLGLLLWGGVMVLVFALAGFLATKVTPGSAPPFFLELPPMRWPSPANVVAKTLSRLHWYFLEVFPLFILASVLIWIGQITGLFPLLVRGFEPVVQFVGLPSSAATAFLFGFFRRDYGAAGLMQSAQAGGLTGTQVVVASVTITIFLPCIAQFLMVAKERGWRMALGIGVTTFATAILVGAGLSRVLAWLRLPL